MSIEAWTTVAIVVLCFSLMASNRVAPDVAMMAGLTLLLFTGILSPAEAFVGLANEGVITVAVLYVVVTGLRETGGVDLLVHAVLGRPTSITNAQTRLMAPVATMSAFLNNTPVVALFIPAVNDWAKKNSLSVSKLMIPLSYASIIGGTCSLIGTSTNLIVNGLLISETNTTGIGMFDLAWVGIPLTIVTFVFILLTHKWLLVERKPVISQFDNVREYTLEMLVEAKSPLVGKSIEQAGLRHLPGLYLIEIDRENHIIPAVSSKEKLQDNDRLIFAGIVDSVVDLQKIRGLKPATNQVFKIDSPRDERCLIEAVVSPSCPLVRKSIREGNFRTRYNAAIIAVARNGEKIKMKIGDIILLPGDTLLLVAGQTFIEQQRNSKDFYLVSQLDDSRIPKYEKALLAIAILAAMVVAVTLGLLSMLMAAMLAAGLMIVTGCTRASIARRSIDWQVLITIAASFGIGSALQVTGAAEEIASGLVSLSAGSSMMSLVILYLVTTLFTALATNNAAAILMFPIALATANSLDVNFLPFAIMIMIGASASFATPIGYQTNLMVYGPGGYVFSDYLRIGLPLTLIVGLISLIIIPITWPL